MNIVYAQEVDGSIVDALLPGEYAFIKRYIFHANISSSVTHGHIKHVASSDKCCVV